MPNRRRPEAPDAPVRRRDDTIVRLLALALTALTITTIPRARLADLLTAAAWITLLASLLLTGVLLRRQARAPDQKRPRARRNAPTRADQRPDEQQATRQSLDDTGSPSRTSPPDPPPAPHV